MNNIENLIENLNKEQKDAVLSTEGPNLIVAGAGSGKTRVLTTRLIHIINKKKAWANQILCVTFTNKAAKEMQNRVMQYIKGKSNAVPWLGTFHSISVKFLRRHAEALGYKSNFSILDTDDQKKLIRNIVKGEDLDAKKFSPQLILYHIDQWKNKGFLPKDVKLEKSSSIIKSILKVYEIYQNKIKDLNAFDFGDLILFCVKLFEEHKDIREIYQNNFKYILVDEFQDTNFIQNKWLNLLVNKNQNICCVGDDDQSIYSWRGAEIKNFLEFDKIYKNTKIIKLEENYRSSQNILNVASELISNNEKRLGKKLNSNQSEGELVNLNCFKNGKDEAINISKILENQISKKYNLNNVAILVRAIFQTREFEERFLKIGLPYRILGGVKFYERAEIKDCIAYLRIVYQNKDDLAFERIVNVPKRSIGDTSFKMISAYAKNNGLSLEKSSKSLIELNKIKPKTKIGLFNFLKLLEKWRNDYFDKKVDHVKLLQIILDESGYSLLLKNKKDLENENRLENIKELLNAMKEFDNLESFLEHVSLATSIDNDWDGEKVNLMTMHSSKGLEFDTVFLPGWEEGLFPHQKSIDEKGQKGLEEERRLAYVGITRAKHEVYISFSLNRFYQGDWIDSISSRFVDELPEKYIKKINNYDKAEDEIFEFNQDLENEQDIYRSPGWLRYQKRLK